MELVGLPALLLSVLCIVATIVRPANNMHTPECMEFCECNGPTIKCDCTANPSSSDVTLTIRPVNFAVDPTTLIIQNCQKVDYHPWFMGSQTPLKAVEIANVGELNLHGMAFFGMSASHSIVIHDTVIQDLLPDSLGHIEGISKIELNNVTITVVKEQAFAGLVNVSHFQIINSQFGTINSGAFPNSFKFVDSFVIANTAIKFLESKAFQMENVVNLTMSNLNINKWQSNALAPSSIGHVSIQHSNVTELHESAFSARNVSNLSVIHNRIKELYPKIFGSIQNVQKFEFSDNVIHEIKKGILLGYDTGSVQQEEFLRNKFQCNPTLCWLLQDEYHEFANRTLLQTSVCNGPPPYTGKSFPEIVELHGHEFFCNDGELGRHALDVPIFNRNAETTTVLMTTDEAPLTNENLTDQAHAVTSHSYKNSVSACFIFVVTCVLSMVF